MYTVNVLSVAVRNADTRGIGEDLGSPSARPGIDRSVCWLSLATIRAAGFAVQRRPVATAKAESEWNNVDRR